MRNLPVAKPSVADRERVSAQLDRILSSGTFAEAERAKRLLRFIVEYAIEGRADEIKESVLGVEVLGRSPTYDPKTDPIVRVEASRLRARLDSYYQSEGVADSLLISIPKGGYTPQFSERQVSTAPVSRRARWPFLLAGILLGATVAAFVGWTLIGDEDRPPTMKLSMLAPPGAEMQYATISPDGSRLAFAAVSQDKQMLWVRELDSLEARPIPGTELSAFPFWAPDSRSIAFFGIDKLKRVELAGGPPQIVCESRVTRGGAWGPDGTIVFAPGPRGVLYKVPAGGGTPQPVTRFDPARSEVAHKHPSFLPDGKHFLYLAVSSRPGESSIRAGSLDGNTDKLLTTADGSAHYAPPAPGRTGFLMFGFGGALMAQPFDPERLELGGGRVTVAPEVLYFRGRTDFSISRTGTLAYRAGSGRNLELVWHNREGKPLTHVGERNSFYSWALSPDEKRIAYQEVALSGGLTSIWILDIARGAATRIVEGYEVFLPVWSPDSNEIAYTVGDDERMILWRQSIHGGSPVKVLDTAGAKFPSDWSSDGRLIAYAAIRTDFRGLEGWVASADRSGDPRLVLNREADVHFSPETRGRPPRWFAYVGFEAGRPEIYVRNFPQADRKWRISTGGGIQPKWRADGRELFFLSLDGTLMSAQVSGDPDLNAGAAKALFETGVRAKRGIHDTWGQDYAVSRDGQRFLIHRRAGEGLTEPVTIIAPWAP